MSNTKFEFHSIGFQANQVLSRNSSAEVYGISRRGIYLQTANDLTLFISFENFRGPLTLNFSGDPEVFSGIKPGAAVKVKTNKIIFSTTRLELSINNIEPWIPPDAPRFIKPQKKFLDDLYQQSKLLVGDDPFFPLLEIVLTAKSIPLPGFPDFFERIVYLSRSLKTGLASNLAWELEKLLGAGPGLTPLGDDLILGILLAINRGRSSFYTGSYLEQLNQKMIDLALDKTTRLSFSLLVCASDGSADERLLKVLDGLLSGVEIRDQDLSQMLAWGSTSGFAVLAGMILVLA